MKTIPEVPSLSRLSSGRGKPSLSRLSSGRGKPSLSRSVSGGGKPSLSRLLSAPIQIPSSYVPPPERLRENELLGILLAVMENKLIERTTRDAFRNTTIRYFREKVRDDELIQRHMHSIERAIHLFLIEHGKKMGPKGDLSNFKHSKELIRRSMSMAPSKSSSSSVRSKSKKSKYLNLNILGSGGFEKLSNVPAAACLFRHLTPQSRGWKSIVHKRSYNPTQYLNVEVIKSNNSEDYSFELDADDVDLNKWTYTNDNAFYINLYIKNENLSHAVSRSCKSGPEYDINFVTKTPSPDNVSSKNSGKPFRWDRPPHGLK